MQHKPVTDKSHLESTTNRPQTLRGQFLVCYGCLMYYKQLLQKRHSELSKNAAGRWWHICQGEK